MMIEVRTILAQYLFVDRNKVKDYIGQVEIASLNKLLRHKL